MQGDNATERMHRAVQSLEQTLRRLEFLRAKARVLDRHRDLFVALAEHERTERDGDRR